VLLTRLSDRQMRILLFAGLRGAKGATAAEVAAELSLDSKAVFYDVKVR